MEMVEKFLEELKKLCLVHGLSIADEDEGFIIFKERDNVSNPIILEKVLRIEDNEVYFWSGL